MIPNRSTLTEQAVSAAVFDFAALQGKEASIVVDPSAVGPQAIHQGKVLQQHGNTRRDLKYRPEQSAGDDGSPDAPPANGKRSVQHGILKVLSLLELDGICREIVECSLEVI